MIKFNLFCLIVIFISTTNAQVDKLLEMMPSDKKTMALSALNFLPLKQKQGIEDYLAVTGIASFGSENKGFKNYNTNTLLTNPCFAELAASFYSDIRGDDLDSLLKSLKSNSSLGKPSLNDKADSPGFLWQKALDFSKGNKYLAMQLVGVCGHDDTSQVDSELLNEQLKIKESFVSKYTADEIDGKLQLIWKHYKSESKKIIEQQPGGAAKVLNDSKSSYMKKTKFQCPSAWNQMYLSKSLGHKYDISDQLKQDIATIQAPTKGMSVLPSKYYHVLGAAYSSCFLVAKDVPNFISEKMVKGAISAYRSSRICERFADNSSPIEQKSVEEIFNNVNLAKSNFNICFVQKISEDSVTNKKFNYWTTKEGNLPDYCMVYKYISIELLRDGDISDQIILNKINRALALRDATQIFAASKFFKNSNKCQGEQLGTDVKDFLSSNRYTINKSDCGLGIDKQRCINARKLIDTFYIDFEWSEAQHMAGFQFAKDNCKEANSTKSIDEFSCEIIGKSSSKNSSATKNENEIKGTR